MLPLLQAEEIKHSIVEYLKSTFNFEDKTVDQAFEDCLHSKRQGMFKGPYMQMRLPFESVSSDEDKKTLNEALVVRPSFAPYIHQFEAFQRLSTRNGHEPEPVILTTGTGSGKTESFLFPLLDYCYQNTERQGIKAIILYPMNALATDQARRLAKEIHDFKDENGEHVLRDKLRAGLFIGEGKDKDGERASRMSRENIIEDRDTLLKSPPDILLTNFKMLDFSLLQARFHQLWKHNFDNKDLLKFIVLDELHTYDGAKGSDVANLLRRLKLKLGLSPNQIVPVGTSATMSGGDDGKRELVSFFSQVFGIEADESAVIEEKRLDPIDFFANETSAPNFSKDNIDLSKFLEKDTYNSYIARQFRLWGYDENITPSVLAGELKSNDWLYQLSEIVKSEVSELGPVMTRWSDVVGLSLTEQELYDVFGSLLAMVTYAKFESGNLQFPFMYVQITYWMRSLSRIVRKLQSTPAFEWESDTNFNEGIRTLPPYFCRECGGSGWIGVKKEHSESFEDDLSITRKQFMADGQNNNVYFVSDLSGKQANEVIADDYEPSGEILEGYLQSDEYILFDKQESDSQFKVIGTRVLNSKGNKTENVCPHCNASNTIALIGTGVATLESIAAAQILATASDPSVDKERKLLAFTNSVQDAAHQAGFIENRNFRFGMRHAIQAVFNNEEENINLKSFIDHFSKHWTVNADDTGQEEIDAYYYKFLPPDCEARMTIDDYREKDGLLGKEFEKEFANRVSWEIWKEYSYNALIGRTLEKSGASATCFDQEKMEEVYDQMKWWLDGNSLGDRVSKEQFLQFLNGFLHRLRTKGGVDHQYLKKYRTERTNYYLITQNVNKKFYLMQNFGKRSRLPKFLTLEHGPNTKAFDIIQGKTKHNWFTTYFLKSFDVGTSELNLINDFYEQLVNYLDSNSLLDKKVASGINNYGLPLDAIHLSKDVKAYECSKCQHQLNTAKEGGDLVEGMACLQYRCSGKYKHSSNKGFDYYRMVYNRGRALRIFANDHTGLIDRNRREAIEIDFKQQPTFNSTNVLVATSTLEMGIDIGDLNVTFNSSLPPETSNYLQRIGRAGRSSGTSLILNIAGRDQHDLYYFQDPEEMMKGEVRTPACYLEARDILKRHFMAFCFDSWASADPESHRIPVMVNLLRLKSHKEGDPTFVFNQIAAFIDKRKAELFDIFKIQYAEIVDGASFKKLYDNLVSNSLTKSLEDLHLSLLQEIDYYDLKRKELNKAIKKLPETGDEVAVLKNERKALSGAIRNINERNVIEYLTNIGILPNYAFPETGVLLNAQIRSRKEVDGATEYNYESFGDIVRASSSAITELAPANVFYSQGQKLESQGIEVRSEDDYELYRFCSNCDHLELDAGVSKNQLTCPSCKDTSWSALSNKKTIVRMKTITSVNDKEGSRITDSTDDRERKFYHKSIHIKVNYKTSEGAHVLKRVPFGIEFFHDVDYIQLNTGIREEGFYGNESLEINGEDHPQAGFVLCKTCGKSTERSLTEYELRDRKRSYHFPYCSNRAEEYKGCENDFFKEIYLYRQFNTEALLVLLPVQEFRSEEKIALFKAGLYLGLKDYYKGKPDHILIQETAIHNQESQRKERYLVLYETIPGGTGYLAQLFDTKQFTNIIKASYERLAFCSCKKENKDGCYSCIYTYGNQFEREILSRSEAEELFKELLDKADEWNDIDSLQSVKGFANNEESDLELKFIDALDRIAKKDPGATFSTENEKGIKKYKLILSNANGSITYEIWPQNLSQNLKGIQERTRPDFLFKCIGLSRGNIEASIEEIEAIKSIAIFLDGYQFHASKDHPRFPTDIIKRNAIIDSDQYYQWTLTWDDFGEELLNDKDSVGEIFSHDNFKRLSIKHPSMKDVELKDVAPNNNISRYLRLLYAPLLKMDLSVWSGFMLFQFQSKMADKLVDESQVKKLVDEFDSNVTDFNPKGPSSFAFLDQFGLSEEANVTAFSSLKDFSVKGFSNYKMLPEWDKNNWAHFWRIYNLMQFHQVKPVNESNAVKLEEENTHQEILDNFDESLHKIVLSLLNHDISFNKEYDFDLLKDDVIIAQAELGSLDKKFILNAFSEEDTVEFKKQGYQIFDVSSFDIDEIL